MSLITIIMSSIYSDNSPNDHYGNSFYISLSYISDIYPNNSPNSYHSRRSNTGSNKGLKKQYYESKCEMQ